MNRLKTISESINEAQSKPATKKDAGKTCASCGHVIYVAKGQVRCWCDSPKVNEAVAKPLDPELKSQFADLAADLSPENLNQDGEISSKEADAKYNELMKKWAELEKKAGRKVSETEVYDF